MEGGQRCPHQHDRGRAGFYESFYSIAQRLETFRVKEVTNYRGDKVLRLAGAKRKSSRGFFHVLELTTLGGWVNPEV